MSAYTINLLLIAGLAWPLCIYKPNKLKTIAYLVITFGFMWFLATYRSNIGFDYHNYFSIFNKIKDVEMGQVFHQGYEPGFSLLTKIMSFFVDDITGMYAIYQALIYIPVAWFIYRYCKDPWLSVWLYVTLSHFYASMNFIRQNLAVSVALFGYTFLRAQNWHPLLERREIAGKVQIRLHLHRNQLFYLIVVLLAASMHKAALLLIPVYFLCGIRLGKVTGIIYPVATCLALLLSPLVIEIVTKYIFKGYKDSIFLNPISTDMGYVMLFWIVPLSLFAGCLALRHIWEKRDPDANMLLNMMLFSLPFWLFMARHFIIERFSQFVYIYALVAVPAAIASLKSPESDRIRLAEMQADTGGKKGKSKEQLFNQKRLAQDISDHQKYYWSAVAGVILISWIYHEFGANVNGFHGVFPYQSVLEIFH